jgi:RimJ/RimL family protein N-acetyltransferase
MTATPTTYVVHVDRHLDDHWSAWFGGGVTLHRDDDGTSRLTVAVADQAQLHGLLAGLRDLNVALVSVCVAGPPTDPTMTGVLRTARLTLRPATAADTEATWAFRRLPEVAEWLTGTPESLEGYRELFTRPDRLASTVVVELASGVVIGDFMLRREDAWAQLEVAEAARDRHAELGWVLDPAYGGQGYATEAVRELLRYCFTELGVRRVHANAFLDNDSSCRLMERVGMRREGHAVRESLHRSGRWLDTVTYALLAEEWAGENGAACS